MALKHAQRIRPAAVAGMFYPGDPQELKRQVRTFLDQAPPAHHAPRALIAPHAGYVYSGPIAGAAYAPLQHSNHEIDKVLLLGPAHREYVDGVAASTASAFGTPLGLVPLDREGIEDLVTEFDFVKYRDTAHRLEHSLEVQLPFLQTVLGRFRLLPFAVGGARPEQLEALLERAWRSDASTLVVVSSDLSHYRDYASAREIDRYTSDKIRRLDPTGLTGDHACGQRPICGLLRYALRHGLKCEVLDVRNSGDTAGDRNRVVGYGAYLFYGQHIDPAATA